MNFWGASAMGFPNSSLLGQSNGWFPQGQLPNNQQPVLYRRSVNYHPGFRMQMPQMQQIMPSSVPNFGSHPSNLKRSLNAPPSSSEPLHKRSRNRWGKKKTDSARQCLINLQALSPEPTYEQELSKTIWRNYIDNRQSNQIYQRKQLLRQTLCDILAPFGRDRVFVVGSSMNGFGTNKSDCDLCLHITASEERLRNNLSNLILTSIRQALFASRLFSDIQFIPARVPILKFSQLSPGSPPLECDLNVNNTAGLLNTRLLALYCGLDWRVRPLGMFVKHWARLCDIHDASRGRLSSYALNLMLLHFLQTCSPPVLPCLQKDFPELCGWTFKSFKQILDFSLTSLPEVKARWRQRHPKANTESLAELFSGFVAYYHEQDFEKSAFSVRLGSTLSKGLAVSQLPADELRRIRSGRSNSKMFVEEPITQSNAARSPYEESVFAQIRRAFAKTNRFLRLKKDIATLAPV